MPRAETRRTQGLPVPRGGFHKAGEGPAFGDSFPSFSSLRKGAQRSVPGRALGSAQEIGAGQSLRPGLRRATSLYTREAFEVKKYGQPKLTVLFVVLELSDGSACAPPRQCSAAARWRPGWPRTPAAETGRQSEAPSRASRWPEACRWSQASGRPRERRRR